LIEALNAYGLEEGMILTEKENEIIIQKDKRIIVKPVYEWLDEIET